MSDANAKRRKHLMVPGEIRPMARGGTSITTVQRWVMSSLAFVTIEHMAAGVALAAVVSDPSRPGARIGLLIVAAGFGTLAVVTCLLIHQRNPVSPWLVAGWLPSLVGAYLCFVA